MFIQELVETVVEGKDGVELGSELVARIRKWCRNEPSHQTILSVYSFNKDNVTQDHLRLAPIVTAPASPEFSLLCIMWVI